uniref:Uncharacterized protein n=1 Tax=viral metagenome TaxID=1070528 RepID=A0A6C0LC35_9ZZZZ
MGDVLDYVSKQLEGVSGISANGKTKMTSFLDSLKKVAQDGIIAFPDDSYYNNYLAKVQSLKAKLDALPAVPGGGKRKSRKSRRNRRTKSKKNKSIFSFFM